MEGINGISLGGKEIKAHSVPILDDERTKALMYFEGSVQLLLLSHHTLTRKSKLQSPKHYKFLPVRRRACLQEITKLEPFQKEGESSFTKQPSVIFVAMRNVS